jgi:hypothetical protein
MIELRAGDLKREHQIFLGAQAFSLLLSLLFQFSSRPNIRDLPPLRRNAVRLWSNYLWSN